VGGVAIALASGLGEAPPGAWRGDLIMAGGAVCMALYNVWSRPFIARSSSLAFVTAGMGIGAASLVAIAGFSGGLGAALEFDASQWTAVASLGLFAAALSFYLWVFALERTTPTRVASTITVNPVTAALLAVPLLGEPIGLNLVLGLAAVGAGIWLASTERPSRASSP
jgi:drug/metabolite transporter (DMT)-like permease